MIPAFPKFKAVNVEDRADVEKHTHRHPAHSDFNFTSLWAWDTSGERLISELNGNLIVRFTDYKTNEPFLSVLGTNKLEETFETLIDYCARNNLPRVLKFISGLSQPHLLSEKFLIEEDRDNFDYIYSVSDLSSFEGRALKGRRNFLNRFTREHPNARFSVIDLADSITQSHILSVIETWTKAKESNHPEYDVEHELQSIKKLIDTAPLHKLIATGVFEGEQMIAFSIEEILPNNFCISHFWKADISHVGLYDFLMQKKAEYLKNLGVEYMNYEQDLGVEGLRKSKMDYRPVDFLRKYKISAKS